ncbi:MAG: nucleotidyltransferase family protein [Clostridia bacterium]|nr:nucleotidyltransferase family protein [Clostridia bacterium]
MLREHKEVVSLIRAALTDFVEVNIGAIEGRALFDLGKKHQILPLLLQGIQKCGITVEEPDVFYNYTFRLACHDQNQMYWLEKLQELFSANDIDYMLLKGSSIKRLYPSSEMRLMGDIDVLIKEEQYPKIKELLAQSGLREEAETNHELIWGSGDGVVVELHKKLIPSYNDDYYAYYSEPWKKAVKTSDTAYAMTPEDEYIYIFTHLTKHYRDGGIGLKHMVDLWFFGLCHPQMDWQYVRSELDKLSLATFHQHIVDTLDVWFNDKPETQLTDYITERIVESGAYGIKEKCDAANAARLSARTASVSVAKRKNIIKLIFLPYADMQHKYPFLRRVPILLPVMWVVRWLDALLCKRNNISRQMERLNKIEENTVDDYTRELAMVGLQFALDKDT